MYPSLTILLAILAQPIIPFETLTKRQNGSDSPPLFPNLQLDNQADQDACFPISSSQFCQSFGGGNVAPMTFPGGTFTDAAGLDEYLSTSVFRRNAIGNLVNGYFGCEPPADADNSPDSEPGSQEEQEELDNEPFYLGIERYSSYLCAQLISFSAPTCSPDTDTPPSNARLCHVSCDEFAHSVLETLPEAHNSEGEPVCNSRTAVEVRTRADLLFRECLTNQYVSGRRGNCVEAEDNERTGMCGYPHLELACERCDVLEDDDNVQSEDGICGFLLPLEEDDDDDAAPSDEADDDMSDQERAELDDAARRETAIIVISSIAAVVLLFVIMYVLFMCCRASGNRNAVARQDSKYAAAGARRHGSRSNRLSSTAAVGAALAVSGKPTVRGRESQRRGFMRRKQPVGSPHESIGQEIYQARNVHVSGPHNAHVVAQQESATTQVIGYKEDAPTAGLAGLAPVILAGTKPKADRTTSPVQDVPPVLADQQRDIIEQRESGPTANAPIHGGDARAQGYGSTAAAVRGSTASYGELLDMYDMVGNSSNATNPGAHGRGNKRVSQHSGRERVSSQYDPGGRPKPRHSLTRDMLMATGIRTDDDTGRDARDEARQRYSRDDDPRRTNRDSRTRRNRQRTHESDDDEHAGRRARAPGAAAAAGTAAGAAAAAGQVGHSHRSGSVLSARLMVDAEDSSSPSPPQTRHQQDNPQYQESPLGRTSHPRESRDSVAGTAGSEDPNSDPQGKRESRTSQASKTSSIGSFVQRMLHRPGSGHEGRLAALREASGSSRDVYEQGNQPRGLSQTIDDPSDPDNGSGTSSIAPSIPESMRDKLRPLLNRDLERPLRASVRYSFEPEMRDEISLRGKDVVYVRKFFDDDWCFGLNLSTNTEGIFPLCHLDMLRLSNKIRYSQEGIDAR